MGIKELCQVRIQSGVPCNNRAKYFAVFVCRCLLSNEAPPVLIDTPLLVCDICRKLKMKEVIAMLATDDNLEVVMSTLQEKGMPEPETIQLGFKMLRSAKRDDIIRAASGKNKPDSFLRIISGGLAKPPEEPGGPPSAA